MLFVRVTKTVLTESKVEFDAVFACKNKYKKQNSLGFFFQYLFFVGNTTV